MVSQVYLHVHPSIGKQNDPRLCFPAEAGPHLTDHRGMEAELAYLAPFK